MSHNALVFLFIGSSIVFAALAHWKIKDFRIATASSAIAAAVLSQVVGAIQSGYFGFGTIVGVLFSVLQSMIISAVVGLAFAWKRGS